MQDLFYSSPMQNINSNAIAVLSDCSTCRIILIHHDDGPNDQKRIIQKPSLKGILAQLSATNMIENIIRRSVSVPLHGLYAGA